MDLESRCCWEFYIKVKEVMLECIYIFELLWWVVFVDDKKKVCFNCIYYLLLQMLYYEIECFGIELFECMCYEDYCCYQVFGEIYVLQVF